MPKALIIKPNDIGIDLDLDRQSSDGMLLGEVAARDPLPDPVTDLEVVGTPTTSSATVRWTRTNDGNDDPSNYLVAIQEVPPSPAPFDGNANFQLVSGQGGAIGTQQSHNFSGLASGRAFESRVLSYRGNEELYSRHELANIVGFSTQSTPPPPGGGSFGENEPSDFTQITDRPFQEISFEEGGIAEGWTHAFTYGGDTANIFDESTPTGDNKAMRLRIGQGETGWGEGGLAHVGYFIPPGSRPRDIYACFWVKVDPWYHHHYLGQKLLYFYDQSATPEHTYCYAALNKSSTTSWYIGGQAVTDIPSPGNNFNFDPTTQHSVQNGQWALVEILIYNTLSSGASNGQFHAWVNGTKVQQHTNVPYAQGGRRWDQISISPTYGGGTNLDGPVPIHQYVHHDRMYISGRNFF